MEQFLDTWLETVRPSVAASTWTPYEGLLRLHALPSIGRLRLSRLGAFNLEQLYSGRIKAGLSPTTVLQLHRVLHHALRDAVRWSLVPRNVSELVSPPRRASYEFRVLSSEQARTFLQAVKGDRLEALYVLAITPACANWCSRTRWGDRSTFVTATMQQQAVAALDGLFGDQLGLQHGGQDGGQVEIE